MTLLQIIGELTWFNLVEKLKIIFRELISLSSNPPIVQIENTNELTFELLPTTKVLMVTYTGTINTTKMPPIQGNDGLIIFLTNAGSGSITLISNTGENDIWEGGINSNTSTVPNSTVMRIINDKLKYRVL